MELGAEQKVLIYRGSLCCHAAAYITRDATMPTASAVIAEGVPAARVTATQPRLKSSGSSPRAAAVFALVPTTCRCLLRTSLPVTNV
jgi:hypothetical protein